jgi:hypothetical protein
MARTYLTFGDIAGKLHALRIQCTRCPRKGRYIVAKLLAQYGRRGNMSKWRRCLRPGRLPELRAGRAGSFINDVASRFAKGTARLRRVDFELVVEASLSPLSPILLGFAFHCPRQEAIAAVSRGIADGAPLVKCQLLASAFYEALRHELRQADATKRSSLLAVTDHCHRSAAANISPVQALNELKSQPRSMRPFPRPRPAGSSSGSNGITPPSPAANLRLFHRYYITP